jgi:hypothetical protein
MAEYPAGQEHLLRQLISTFRCGICRRSFEHKHVRVAARHEHLWIVSARCTRCRNQQVFWIDVKDNGEETVLRDVSAVEEEQFAAMEAVTADDVLDVHEFLQDFDGDFKRLFGE